MPNFRPRNGIEELAERFGPVMPRRPALTVRQAFEHKLSTTIVFKDSTFLVLNWIVDQWIAIQTNNQRFVDRFAPANALSHNDVFYMRLGQAEIPAVLMFLAAMDRPKSVKRN